MRWAIEQCFQEGKEHLGMDHYEVRIWQGWHRHILITLVSHLFVIKLRKQTSISPQETGNMPYIDSPVPLDEYLDAAERMSRKEPVDGINPHMMEKPTKP